METVAIKKCTRCKEMLPLSCFAVQESTVDGLRYNCNTCLRAYNNAYQAKRRAKREAAGAGPRKRGPKPKVAKAVEEEPASWPIPAEPDLTVQLLHLHTKRAYGAVPMGRSW